MINTKFKSIKKHVESNNFSRLKMLIDNIATRLAILLEVLNPPRKHIK